ncbi:MAG: FtsX-like permease family protein [Zetaproteobacteria bacterium]|nr:MAG: FtsX-like permease family protein [Zetaproteobacteria bacterium]
MNGIPDQVRLRLPGGFHLPPFGIHQLLAAVIVCVALWTLGLGWLGLKAADQWVGSWQDELTVHVYLDVDKPSQRESLEKALRDIDGVVSVTLIEPKSAAKQMQSWIQDIGLDEQALASHLPWTFELGLHPQDHEFLYEDIRDAAHRHQAEVNESEMALANAHQWLDQIRLAAGFATLVLALAMMLIISNALRMTLLARADEIHLMRLLGAREWFVRMPFVLEGLVVGAGAGGLAWVLLWPIIALASDWLDNLGLLMHPWSMLLPLLLGGTAVGGLGAVLATLNIMSSEQRLDTSS